MQMVRARATHAQHAAKQQAVAAKARQDSSSSSSNNSSRKMTTGMGQSPWKVEFLVEFG
jgi:hypothetical protein